MSVRTTTTTATTTTMATDKLKCDVCGNDDLSRMKLHREEKTVFAITDFDGEHLAVRYRHELEYECTDDIICGYCGKMVEWPADLEIVED